MVFMTLFLGSFLVVCLFIMLDIWCPSFYFIFYYYFLKYLFIWLCWVLVVACWIFVAV